MTKHAHSVINLANEMSILWDRKTTNAEQIEYLVMVISFLFVLNHIYFVGETSG